MAGNPDEEVPELAEETSRLAILDLDWTKVTGIFRADINMSRSPGHTPCRAASRSLIGDFSCCHSCPLQMRITILSCSVHVQVRAVDIFAMLQSFLKKGQQLKKVTVYPSDYGLERLKEEARFGPQGLSTARNGASLTENGTGGGINGRSYTLSKEERAAVLETLNEEESDDEGIVLSNPAGPAASTRL